MQFQHIVTGDMAAASLKAALNLVDSDIVNMDDDLSVGPLTDVDAAAPIHRAAFWRKVMGPEAADYERNYGTSIDSILATTSAAFKQLASDSRPCLVWCGTNANEQLTLRRTAHFLRTAPRALWIVEVKPADQKPLPLNWSTAVALLRESELVLIYERRRELSPSERAGFAEDWRKVCANGDDTSLRMVVNGRIETQRITAYDDHIHRQMQPGWQPTVRVVGNAMGHLEEHEASDTFIFWRLRELAKRGHLEIDLPDAGMRESKIRLLPPR
jgi:hypothetical protein